MVSRLTTSGIDQEIAGSSPAVGRNFCRSYPDINWPPGEMVSRLTTICTNQEIADTFEPPLPPVWISRPASLYTHVQRATMSENEVDALASAIFDTMLEDMVLGIALDEHKAGMRTRAVCAICHMRCRLEEHINQRTNTGLPGTPNSGNTLINGDANGGANSNGSNASGAKGEPVPMADCIKCKRTIVSTRYASHLATCMGLGNARRAGPRNAASKARASTESGPATPTQRSGSVNSEDVPPPVPATKPKPSKKKKKPEPSASDTTNENNKREGALPAKTAKSKKQKVGKGVNKAANGKPLAFQPSLCCLSLPESRRPQCLAYLLSSKILNTYITFKLEHNDADSYTKDPPAAVPSSNGTAVPPRVVRGTGPPRPLLGRGPSIPRTVGAAAEKPHPPPPTRQSSGRTDADGDDDLVDTASDSSDDT
ncbi:hypothetical protein RhiXN_02178 [Rhizoctonia solani]|uniref:SAGA-associated factor 11 n=1 Tax=Rhizoctonia solani TaxID=456999 RepID=A0A8H8T4M9_9AGAM|nr:uncharacterized protein RhiXN_02178 [Rhizoctonia solani]QRW27583.1 hypothetical protein RhiXN_02178 [Rhizoctonia solani]